LPSIQAVAVHSANNMRRFTEPQPEAGLKTLAKSVV
jgi:hypothetical protein